MESVHTDTATVLFIDYGNTEALSIFGFVCNLQDCDLSLFLCFVVLILLFNPITSSRSHVSKVRCYQEDHFYQGCPGVQVARQSARISRRIK